jgi:glycyl-tRNA synthetase
METKSKKSEEMVPPVPAAVPAEADAPLSREDFKNAVKNTLERRLFYIPSFKIYGGVAGLYDYGPWGCAVETNVLNLWRQVSVSVHN